MKTYNDTTYAILGILTTDCTSGYDIKKLIDQSLNHFWKISYGQIYPTLKLLVEEELAEVAPSSEGGRKERNEYSLTEKGVSTLKAWLEEPVQQLPVEKNEILLKLFFGNHQSNQASIRLIEDYRTKLETRYQTYTAIEKSIQEHESASKDAKYWLYTLDYGKRTTKAAINWCEATIKNITEGEDIYE
ncbi:hypothetical conserved protein [Oceanobacillus iheyensis HTE831]|uniref:Hypothetical conserved protein n=1 Tax=Oceanobacillus iheyensis (strain DSM 14371 / CIP 107618 / JCM 11309 / KCTC 3954 / HTE831) TaxID=221109 RepID=Q8ELJ9_OCEIH|nr:PadR family transcriptional regulator [Oceanobacillus iheyensis]BAC15184.1 hypothetical conserved protein [Oceanobacillus iheyensis HTE831]